MTEYLTTGQKIALFRKKAGFTQAAIAASLKVSRSLVGQIEKDLTKPNLDFLSGFIKLVHCKYDDILNSQQMVERLDSEVDEFKKGEDVLLKNTWTTSIDQYLRKLSMALNSIFEVYFIILEPIYERMPKGAPPESIRQTLIDGFNENKIVKKHISLSILSPDIIQTIIERFLTEKQNES